MQANDTLYVIVGVFLLLILLSVYRRRELIAKKLRWAFVALASYALTILIVRQLTTDPVKIVLSALLVEVLIAARTQPRRSRYISRTEKRKVIARFERSGRRYNPKDHEIDHIVPYSRGGDSRAHNLRIIERDRNRAKS